MQPTQRVADLIVIAPVVHTLDDASVNARAFAVRDGRFTYVGDVDGAMAWRGPRTEVLGVRDGAVLPGIVDAHLHLTNLGLSLQQVALDDARGFNEAIDRTRSFAQTSGEQWILGRGWDQNSWQDAAFPAHDALSAAIPDRPVVLTRVDGHAAIANARAMELAGITRATPDPPGGRIVRDRDGAPTGLFIDAALSLIYGCVPKPDRARLMRAIRAGIAECNRWGVTAVAEPGCDEAVLAAHEALLGTGEYPMRTHAMIEADPALIEYRTSGGIVDGAYDGRFSVRAIKMYADGALGSRGAALLAPYADDPSNDGLVLAPQAQIEAVAARALATGFQLCVHAIGDRANRSVLDAFEAALPRGGDGDPRFRVEHAQIVAPGDIPRFARLGAIASVQATHASSDMRWAGERLGPERLAGAYAWRAMLDAGAVVANGTDAPVEPVNTVRTFLASISAHGAIDHRMTRREALASMTIAAAYANFQERRIGSIAEGKYADFVVLNRDWMAAAPDEIAATRVVATYFAGRCVYERATS